MDATEEVLRRHGPEKTNVVDVARALNVSHGTIYRHFSSKEVLRDAVTRRWLRRVEQPLAAISREEGPAETRIRRWLGTLIGTKREKRREDPEMFATYYQLAQGTTGIVDQHVTELIDQLTVIVADGQKAEAFHVADAETAARAVFHATARFHHPARADTWDDPAIDEQFDAVWHLVRKGLRVRSEDESDGQPQLSRTGSPVLSTDTMSTPGDRLRGNEVEGYLGRLGVEPGSIGTPDFDILARLQRVHVTTVPFETLAITGDPYGEQEGEGVVLSVPHLYEKIVERAWGGYCFELSGLFHTLLAALGYEVQHTAARVASGGAIRTPANHHVNVVDLDRRYVVDVGTGPPMLRRPLPLGGTPQTDEVGIEWRVAASERPDAAYRTEYRRPDDKEWSVRYVFDDTPRPLHYFEAASDYLQSAPESPFTGAPRWPSQQKKATGSCREALLSRSLAPSGTNGRFPATPGTIPWRSSSASGTDPAEQTSLSWMPTTCTGSSSDLTFRKQPASHD
jgi:N-hydroxyarylamine O-acetyltransferase